MEVIEKEVHEERLDNYDEKNTARVEQTRV
jgi:hypothetical protein